jgi:lipoprotein-anchoring transpeptidase ErfK/SrfK
MRRLAFALICAFGALGALSSPVLARSPAPQPAPAPAPVVDPFAALFGGGSFAPQTSDGRPQAVAVPRETVAFDARYAPGTVIIATNERRLYYVLGNGQAIRYGVGVGRPGFDWKGVKTVSAMKEWPDWRPPAEMRLRQPYLPEHMPGGPNNPLGARALYLGSSLYRIHGSNEPHTIGSAVSSGCFRMRNQDVIDLYGRVKVGARVVVL